MQQPQEDENFDDDSFPLHWQNAPGDESMSIQEMAAFELDRDSHYEDFTPEQKLHHDLEKIKKRYSILIYGGRPLICFRDPINGLQFHTFEAFHKFHAHLNYLIIDEESGKEKKVYASRQFVEDPKTIRYENMVFDPSGKAPKSSWNLWTGFKVKPIPGDVDLFLKLVAALANDDKSCEEYFLNYCSHMLKKPDELPQKAIVMRGAQGIGKGTIMNTINMFTDNFKHLSTSDGLTGNFNGHLLDAFVVFSDEAMHDGDKAAEGRMKALITEPTITINSKGKDVVSVKNFIRLFVASNEDWAVPVGEGDRRYFVMDCSPRYKNQVEPGQFFYEYNKWIKNGGIEAIFHYLLTRDISNFNPRVSPKTAGRVQLLIKGLNPSLKFVYELLAGNIELKKTAYSIEGERIRWYRKALYKALLDWLPTQRIKAIPTTDDFGKHISKAFNFENDNPKWKTNWKTREDYFYEVPSLKEAKERFANNIADSEVELVFFNVEEQEGQ